MRIMIGIKLRKFVLMRITVSMKLAEFHPNPHQCTHTSRKRPFLTAILPSDNHKSYDLGGKHRKNVHFYCFRVSPNPICRRRAESKPLVN